MCAMLRTQLLDAGYRVVTARNGRDAVKAWGRESFDLVLTDILMPDRDGIELMGDMRKTRPDLPIVAMSGGGRAPAAYYLKLARLLGAKAILEKPFSKEQLLMTVAFALPDEGG